MTYESTKTVESLACPGVRFTVVRMSFGGRLELLRRVRELGARLEFHDAGETLADRVEAAAAAGEIDRLYLEWGVRSVDGLEIDGSAADVAALIERGPEALCREAVDAVKRECSLSEEERKN